MVSPEPADGASEGASIGGERMKGRKSEREGLDESVRRTRVFERLCLSTLYTYDDVLLLTLLPAKVMFMTCTKCRLLFISNITFFFTSLTNLIAPRMCRLHYRFKIENLIFNLLFIFNFIFDNDT